MDSIQAKNFLLTNRGYLKWGDKRLAEKLGIPVEVASSLKSQLKGGRKQTSEENLNESYSESREDLPPDSDFGPYEEHLEELGVRKEDVASVKMWQTFHGEHRFSVVVRYDPEIDYERYMEEHFDNHEVPTFIPQRFDPDNVQEKCGVINLYDAHIDKLPFAVEYNIGNRTIEDNVSEFKGAFEELLNTAYFKHGVEKLYFPIGHDFWNSNAFDEKTKHGTDQSLLVPKQRSFEIGFDLLRDCIEMAAQIIPHVVVVVVGGNHDKDDCFYLGQMMRLAYEKIEQVDVSYTIEDRKYFQYHKLLLGLTHGRNLTSKKAVEKIPLRMAQEAPYKWAETHQGMRVLLAGHIHHEEEYMFLKTKDAIGCQVRFLRGVGAHGAWEDSMGYVGIPKTAELICYNREGNRKWNEQVVWW